MKRMFAITVLFLAAGPGSAGEKEARAILERAIKAHGGADALKKSLTCKRTDIGTQALIGKEVPFVSQVTRSLPDRVRLHVELDKKFTTTLVIDGDRGWQSEGRGPSNPLPALRLRELREEAYVWWLATLVPLLKEGFTLDTVPETKVEGDPAAGVKVTRRGHNDTTLYFSKRNGLLLRISRKGLEGGSEVDKEYLYGGYREISGVTVATKETVRVNGKKWTDISITGYSFPEKLEASAFARP